MPAPKLAKAYGRHAFGDDPAGYHASRPDYPDWLWDVLCTRCGLGRNTATFEIGAGTGIATRRLIEFGADPLIAVEPDRRMADFLGMENADAALTVLVAPFDQADLEEKAFDLGVSATAFHWLDEDRALARIAALLRPCGWWAAFWNVFGDPARPDSFHRATAELLRAPSSPSAGDGRIPFGLDTAARTAALRCTGAFDIIESEVRRWPLVLDADGLTALYATYSNVRARPDRDVVLAELGRIARDVFADRVVLTMTTSLHIARRAEGPVSRSRT